jgi:hypothetical protein
MGIIMTGTRCGQSNLDSRRALLPVVQQLQATSWREKRVRPVKNRCKLRFIQKVANDCSTLRELKPVPGQYQGHPDRGWSGKRGADLPNIGGMVVATARAGDADGQTEIGFEVMAPENRIYLPLIWKE